MLERFWSSGVVILIFGVLVLGTEFLEKGATRTAIRSESGHALASVLSIALLIHAWLKQRTYIKTWHGLVLSTLVLGLPALACTWLGLNVIRFYSYAPDAGHNIYWFVVQTQDIIVWSGKAVMVIVVLWSIFELAFWLGKRVSPSQARY